MLGFILYQPFLDHLDPVWRRLLKIGINPAVKNEEPLNSNVIVLSLKKKKKKEGILGVQKYRRGQSFFD